MTSISTGKSKKIPLTSFSQGKKTENGDLL